jgi:hypothetical protein
MHLPVPRWWWVCDATPGSRVSAIANEASEENPADAPSAAEQPSFGEHVKPLFRERDRASMRFAFDLWSYEDVSEHADAILERLRDGSMPCDGAWTPEQIQSFERWIEAGKLA